MPNNKHAYLKNEPQENDGFKKKRYVSSPEVTEEEEEHSKILTVTQKERLRGDNVLFYAQRRRRRDRKTLEIPVEVDLVRIHFFTVFDADLQNKFFAKYGLNIVEYLQFNKTVLFEIVDSTLFNTFVAHIELAYESSDGESYEGKQYNLVALIYRFEFITTQKRLGAYTEEGLLINLVSSASRSALTQRQLLFDYLNQNSFEVYYNERFPGIIEIKTIDERAIRTIARNFDIVKMVTSARSARIRPGTYGATRREFGFTTTVPENLTIVAVIDTGVSMIDPLRNLMTAIRYDHTGQGANWDESGHGTMVAGLIAFGEEFNQVVKVSYEAKARIAVIKAIHADNDEINIPRLLMDIRDAKRTHGVRIFNMSLNIPVTKRYNESFSAFAYELDKLSYQENILIIMSVGNMDEDELERLLNVDFHPSHNYPVFFYDLDSSSAHHSCWFTNIQEPSESLNNLSIGAIAGNLEGDNTHNVTPASNYPAYYTRKFHLDYNQEINGTLLSRNQKNKHLNKPDLVFEGGDHFAYDSKMEVLRSPLDETEKYFGRSCGTSLATPLICSYAAEILNTYPQLNVQSVKALLINAGNSPCNDDPDFAGFGINLLQKLTGHGKPRKNNLVYSDDNSAVFVIESELNLEEVKVIPLSVPDYIARSGNKLRFTMTLCYNFLPVKDNHLSYLPLHMSFGLFKSVEAVTIAGANVDQYKIKSSISWSEDFFGVENRLFSNVQKLAFNLQAHDVEALNNAVAVAVRCTGKKNIPANDRKHLEDDLHPFSIVITVMEIPEAKASGSLNSELMAINEIKIIGEADIEDLGI